MTPYCSAWSVNFTPSGGSAFVLLSIDDECVSELLHRDNKQVDTVRYLRADEAKTFHRGGIIDTVTFSRLRNFATWEAAYNYKMAHTIELRSLIDGTLQWTRENGNTYSISDANIAATIDVIAEGNQMYVASEYTVTGSNLQQV